MKKTHRDLIEKRDVDYRPFAFTRAQKRRIKSSLPSEEAIRTTEFIERIERIVSIEQTQRWVTQPAKERRRTATKIARLAAELYGALNIASPDVLSDILNDTQMDVERFRLSICDNSGQYLLSIFVMAVEKAAIAASQRTFDAPGLLLIRNSAFAYQSCFGLKPTHNKNSAYVRAIEAINLELAAGTDIEFPTGMRAIKAALTNFGSPNLPHARRGRKPLMPDVLGKHKSKL